MKSKRKKLLHHRSFRVDRIYDGSIRRPRVGTDDNKSVGLKLNTRQAWGLAAGLAKFLLFSFTSSIGKETLPYLTITAYKYNKGPKGHAATLTSPSK